MIQTRGLSLSWGVITELIHGCVSVIWLASLVSSTDIDGTSPSNGTMISGRAAGTRQVQLQTIPEVLAQCGKPVTLTCDASSDSELGIKEMSWVNTVTELCKFENGKPLHEGPGVKCESTGSETGHRLTMTLLNMMPDSQGQYTCKLRSRLGISNDKANITLQECFGNSNHEVTRSNSKSQLECRFYGIYPLGTVHWFQGTANLTHDATTDTEEDQNRLFTIKSTLEIHEMHQPVNCSLWIPGTRTHLTTEIIPASQTQLANNPADSSPTLAVKLLWIPIMVGHVVVKSIT